MKKIGFDFATMNSNIGFFDLKTKSLNRFQIIA